MPRAVSLDAYHHARRHAGAIDRSDRGRIVVTGADRASYLQGLLTNDVVALKSGQGCYAAYLTPHGRMIADVYVYELGDLMLITTVRTVKDTLLAKFEQFIFSEDVQLGDVTDTFSQTAVVGLGAAAIVASLLEDTAEATLRALPEHGNVRGRFESAPAIITRVTDTGEPGFDIVVERHKLDALRQALSAKNVITLDDATADALRIEAGVPEFGRDMDEDTIPLEAGIEQRAISFTKGCYVGQEVIIRVLHRGHGRVARKLVGLTIEGSVPPPAESAVTAHGEPIGRVTSSILSPALGTAIALGYVQRDHAAPGTAVMIGDIPAIVSSLPFRP